jgi:hypothetical protein
MFEPMKKLLIVAIYCFCVCHQADAQFNTFKKLYALKDMSYEGFVAAVKREGFSYYKVMPMHENRIKFQAYLYKKGDIVKIVGYAKFKNRTPVIVYLDSEQRLLADVLTNLLSLGFTEAAKNEREGVVWYQKGKDIVQVSRDYEAGVYSFEFGTDLDHLDKISN